MKHCSRLEDSKHGKFRIWAGSVLQRLRQNIGLKQYEIMRMTDPDIHDQINYMLDDIFYDPDNDQLMCSVTV